MIYISVCKYEQQYETFHGIGDIVDALITGFVSPAYLYGLIFLDDFLDNFEKLDE